MRYQDPKYSDQRSEVKMEQLKIDIDWNDTERVNFLFAPFRDRSVNPTSYDIKMKFWVDAIDAWMKANTRVAFKIDDIVEAFTTKTGQRPHCLQEIFLHLWKDKRKWMLLTDLESSWSLATESSWIMWGLKGSGKLLTNALKSMASESGVPSSSVFVSIKSLESAQESLLCKLRSAPSVMKINEHFFILVDDLHLTAEEESIVLRHLVGAKYCRLQKLPDGRSVIKFSKVATQTSSSDVKSEELDIVRLHIVLRDLENSNLVADAKLVEMQISVRKALQDKQRNKAKEILKTAKRLQCRVDKRRATEYLIREILSEIEEASSNAKIIESYSTGLKALQGQLAKTKSLKDTQDLMDDIKDAIEESNDISEALSFGIADESTDEESLLRELEQLEVGSNDAKIVDLIDALRVPEENLETSMKPLPKVEKVLEKVFS